jgi:hypothetical protein
MVVSKPICGNARQGGVKNRAQHSTNVIGKSVGLTSENRVFASATAIR